MCDVYGEAYFNQKNVYKCAKHGFCPYKTKKKTIQGVETLCSGQEKISGTVISKEGQDDSLLKRLITIDFLEWDATANSASYCQLLRKNFTL